ncbi:MAG: O-antigen ligase family protein [Bacteroidota bacterium]
MPFSSSSFPAWLSPRNLAWFGTLAAVVALSTSKAVLSISTALIALGGVWHLIAHRKAGSVRPLAWWMASIWGLAVLGWLLLGEGAAGVQNIWSKLPFLLLGLTYGVLPAFSSKQQYGLLAAFVLIQSIITVISLGYFFHDYELAMGRLARNAHIDIAGSINHIYFGLLLSFSVFAAVWLWRSSIDLFGKWEHWVWGILALVLFASLHVLIARTGLLAFYAAAGISLVTLAIRRRAWIIGGGALFLLLAVPVVSFYTIPSFEMKLRASWWDLQGYRSPDRDLTHHSASLRLVAYEAAWRLFTEQPLVGRGLTRVEPSMATAYAEMEIHAQPEALPTNPHNQYLEYLVAYGMVGAVLLILVCIRPFWEQRSKKTPLLLISFVAMYMTAMLVESLLERQVGVYFFVIFLPLLSTLNQADSKAIDD